MNRIPLLQSIDGGSRHASPWGSPSGTPRISSLLSHTTRRRMNKGIKVLPIVLIACVFCFSITKLAGNDNLGIFGWQSTRVNIQWGPDAEKYQACRSVKDEPLPKLLSMHRWRSSKKLPKESITIVTQLSLERLSMLLRQCQAWPDRIAAAVYLPIIDGIGAASAEVQLINGTSIKEAKNLLNAFHKKLESTPNACALDMQLVVEQFNGWDDKNLGLYPFNAIRNRALMLARTDAVLLLDVDFLPSATFPESYQRKPRVYSKLIDRLIKDKVAMVLPAFETNSTDYLGRKMALKVASGGKDHAISAWRKHDIAGFQIAQYKLGHTSTNYSRWLTAEKPYSIKYTRGYEPYVVIARRYVPWYDERFRGYRYDKITHIEHISRGLKIRFMVHPTEFVVHCPHIKSSTFKATKETGQWEKLRYLYLEVHEEIPTGDFVPVTAFAKQCLRHVEENTETIKALPRKYIRKSAKKPSSSVNVMTTDRNSPPSSRIDTSAI